MIKIENVEAYGFDAAIRGMRARGCKETKNGKFKTYVSDNSKTVSLGTYESEEEAREAVANYRIKRLCSKCSEYGLDPSDGLVWDSNYIVFPSGDILNMHGEKIVGCVNRNGYVQGIINGKTTSFHRIIAKAFVPNPNNYEQVNHKDGNKTNNNVDNLEWCTRSENLIHAYKSGLEKRVVGEMHHSHKLTNEAVVYIKTHYKKRDKQFGAVPLGKKFGVDRTTILDVARGKTWREVTA